jgi:uncharacterized protein (TIGR03083 family)
MGLEEVYPAMLALFRGLPAEDWERPTPCSEWDVRQLVSHVAAGTSLFEGLPQPPLPDGWTTNHVGIHALSAELLARRQTWGPEEILDELEHVTKAQLERFQNLDEKGWRRELATPAPPGSRHNGRWPTTASWTVTSTSSTSGSRWTAPWTSMRNQRPSPIA